VRNAMDFNKFMGKIQRVSVNTPLQGLAGDFMRMALNRVCGWVLSDPDIQSVFRLHSSVHDEIDFIVKNEYIPFVIPRITRLMKLRTLHEKAKWPVPVECDVEYGRSWDVEHHVTGDDDHKPAAWTEIPELATYVPDGFDIPTLKNLRTAILSGDERRKARAEAYLKENLHPRAFGATKHALNAKDAKECTQYLIASLQLHEFWTIDHIPDSDTSLENLASFEAHSDLTPANRGGVPEMGYLGAIPLTAKVTRPVIEILGEPVLQNPPNEGVSLQDITITVSTGAAAAAAPPIWEEHPSGVAIFEVPVREDEATSEAQTAEILPNGSTEEEDSVFMEVKTVKRPILQELIAPSPDDGIPDLIDEFMEQATALRFVIAMGTGNNTVVARYRGKKIAFSGKKLDYIPEAFVKPKGIGHAN
jgi:hypothetical protein